MANHASALKAHRQSLRRNERNRHHLSRLKSGIKQLKRLIETGKTEEARAQLGAVCSLVDKSVQKKVISGNAAARQKSRLTRALGRTPPSK